MWMAELAEQSGLSVPTIKYYLREGLLPPGEAVGATRSRYDESHVRRLRLIRSLTDVAGLRLETVRQVLEDVDGATSWQRAVGSAHTRLTPPLEVEPTAEATAIVAEFLRRQRWPFPQGNPLPGALARAIDGIQCLGVEITGDLLDAYGDAMRGVAREEIRSLNTEDPQHAALQAVIGTLLLEPILATVRRMAQEQIVMATDRSRLS
jgi:DNA-binding transcriptional MerR regulator